MARYNKKFNNFKIVGDVVEIELTKNKIGYCDVADWERVKYHKWFAHEQPKTFYIKTNIDRSIMALHTLIMCPPPGFQVNHKDYNGLNCRRENLELCTSTQNTINERLRSNNLSGYKGVSWYKRDGKWRSYIRPNGKQIHLGYFDDPKEAAIAYNKAAKEIYGYFAFLNPV